MNCPKNEKILDNIIDVLGITEDETGMPPITHRDRAIVKLQLLHAQILTRDVIEISKINRDISREDILNRLFDNWTKNVKSIVNETLNNEKLSLNMDLLEDFSKTF